MVEEIEIDCESSKHLHGYLQQVIDDVDEKGAQLFYLGEHALTELYIEPDVTVNLSQRRYWASQNKPDTRSSARLPRRDSWLTLVRSCAQGDTPMRAVVLSGPGSGKPLLLAMTARRLAQDGLTSLTSGSGRNAELVVPVFLKLSELAAIERVPSEPPDSTPQKTLANLLQGRHPGLGAKASDYVILPIRNGGRAWLLLDGLDEVVDSSALNWVFAVLRNWNCNLVITTRPHAAEAVRFPFDVRKYQLLGFSWDQINTFLSRRVRNRRHGKMVRSIVQRNKSVWRLAANPYLLTLICWVADRHRLPSEFHRTWLYDRVLKDLLGLPVGGGSNADHGRAAAWFPLLSDMVLAHQHEFGGAQMLTSWLLDYVIRNENRPTLHRVSTTVQLTPRQQAEFLIEELRAKGLLFPYNTERSSYYAAHPSLAEYLAACALVDALEGRRSNVVAVLGSNPETTDPWHILDRICWHPKWRNIVAFLAGKLRDPKAPLIGVRGVRWSTTDRPSGPIGNQTDRAEGVVPCLCCHEKWANA